jgi:F0F1-type ATP synthase assembly protein I
MRKSAANNSTTQSVDDSKDPFRDLKIVQSFADTTCRIAVPVVGLTMMGIYVDTHYGTKPWMTLVGTVVGFALAAMLVKRQISAVTTKKDNPHE